MSLLRRSLVSGSGTRRYVARLHRRATADATNTGLHRPQPAATSLERRPEPFTRLFLRRVPVGAHDERSAVGARTGWQRPRGSRHEARARWRGSVEARRSPSRAGRLRRAPCASSSSARPSNRRPVEVLKTYGLSAPARQLAQGIARGKRQRSRAPKTVLGKRHLGAGAGRLQDGEVLAQVPGAPGLPRRRLNAWYSSRGVRPCCTGAIKVMKRTRSPRRCARRMPSSIISRAAAFFLCCARGGRTPRSRRARAQPDAGERLPTKKPYAFRHRDERARLTAAVTHPTPRSPADSFGGGGPLTAHPEQVKACRRCRSRCDCHVRTCDPASVRTGVLANPGVFVTDGRSQRRAHAG